MKDAPNYIPENTIFRPIPYAKYTRMVYHYITGSGRCISPAWTLSKPITIIYLVTTGYILLEGYYNMHMFCHSACNTWTHHIHRTPPPLFPTYLLYVKRIVPMMMMIAVIDSLPLLRVRIQLGKLHRERSRGSIFIS